MARGDDDSDGVMEKECDVGERQREAGTKH